MALYVHSIVTSEQVTRFGTVKKEKAVSGVVTVVIWTKVRWDGGEDEMKSTSMGKVRDATGYDGSPGW